MRHLSETLYFKNIKKCLSPSDFRHNANLFFLCIMKIAFFIVNIMENVKTKQIRYLYKIKLRKLTILEY